MKVLRYVLYFGGGQVVGVLLGMRGIYSNDWVLWACIGVYAIMAAPHAFGGKP